MTAHAHAASVFLQYFSSLCHHQDMLVIQQEVILLPCYGWCWFYHFTWTCSIYRNVPLAVILHFKAKLPRLKDAQVLLQMSVKLNLHFHSIFDSHYYRWIPISIQHYKWEGKGCSCFVEGLVLIQQEQRTVWLNIGSHLCEEIWIFSTAPFLTDEPFCVPT